MSRSVNIHDPYLNYGVPDEIADNLKDFFPDEDGLSYEEVLLQQASMYQSFQERETNKSAITYNDDDDISDWGYILEDEGESSRHQSSMSQEEIDEALARSLQELGEGFDELIISQHSASASGSGASPIATPATAHAASSNLRQDNIDPDNMQYEELLNLGEAIGVENRGISAARISSCVICQMNFEHGERLITLPCSHQYHTKCISDWLKLKKNCPICQKEVV